MSTERTTDITTEEVATTTAVPEVAPEATPAPATETTIDTPAATEQPATAATETTVAEGAATPADDGDKRKRERSGSHERRHHPDSSDHHHTHKHSRHESSHGKPQALSAAAKKESELSPDTCVRYGVFEPRREISKEEFIDEMEAIRMMGAVEQIVLEPYTPGQDHYFWARIYFNSPESADIAATELNIPLRKSKWRLSVTQRLPLKGPNSGEIDTIPAFQPFVCDIVDTVVVDTQEGYVAFSTDELYLSRSASEFIDAKRNGRLIRRLICKHFDAERRMPCKYGVGCSFMHIKATAVNRLLRTVNHRAPLRFTKQEEDIQVGTWEYGRRHDTLLVRHLGEDMSQKDLSYMFANCPGFVSCSVFATKDDKTNRNFGARYGLIRFDSKQNAMSTLLQTFDSNLNIGFFGVMEDIRRMQMHSVKEQKLLPSTFDSSQQTHLFFSPITNQVIGLADRGDRRNFNNPNNNNQNNSRYQNNNNNPNVYNRPRDQYNQQHGQGGPNNNYGRYNNNQGRPHDYGNDRYNNFNNSNSAQPFSGASETQEGHLFAAPAPPKPAATSAAAQPAEPVPFPALPAGWGYGVSRRNGKYYFFEHGSKAPTTFKHPVTGEKYGGN